GRDGALTGASSPGAAQRVRVVTIDLPHMGPGYLINATIDSQNPFMRFFGYVPDPVWGDMLVEQEQNFNHLTVDGVTFPVGWHHHEVWDDERGWRNLSGG